MQRLVRRYERHVSARGPGHRRIGAAVRRGRGIVVQRQHEQERRLRQGNFRAVVFQRDARQQRPDQVDAMALGGVDQQHQPHRRGVFRKVVCSIWRSCGRTALGGGCRATAARSTGGRHQRDVCLSHASQQKVRRLDALFKGPQQLFSVAVTATLIPAIFGRNAAAGAVFTRKTPGFGGRRRSQGQSHHAHDKNDQQQQADGPSGMR